MKKANEAENHFYGKDAGKQSKQKMIVCDRRQVKSAKGFTFGKAGSGRAFFVKKLERSRNKT